MIPVPGFAMTYGVFQEYYLDHRTLYGGSSGLGVVGTTSNGVMYLTMPFIFMALTRRWARYRLAAALTGVALSGVSFLLSSFSTQVWQIVVTQGILAALGCALIYSPTTLSLGEHFSINNRAVALGVTLSCKNIVGSTCPFLLQSLLDHYGFRTTMMIWAGISTVLSLIGVLMMPMSPNSIIQSPTHRPRKIPWHFLRHETIYIYGIATLLQSSGYGLPQTYLATYARSVTSLSATSATLLITLFNIPGIVSASFFGLLLDNKRMALSASTTATVSAVGAALAALFFWGFASSSAHSMTLLVMFALIYGFFAGGYSSIWGGVIKEMERQSAERNEALDTGIVYGLLNGARGLGYVGGGIAGVQLLKAGDMTSIYSFGYSTSYGPLILYTGLSTAFGGWSILFSCRRLLNSRRNS